MALLVSTINFVRDASSDGAILLAMQLYFVASSSRTRDARWYSPLTTVCLPQVWDSRGANGRGDSESIIAKMASSNGYSDVDNLVCSLLRYRCPTEPGSW